jgi:hypothetical protein
MRSNWQLIHQLLGLNLLPLRTMKSGVPPAIFQAIGLAIGTCPLHSTQQSIVREILQQFPSTDKAAVTAMVQHALTVVQGLGVERIQQLREEASASLVVSHYQDENVQGDGNCMYRVLSRLLFGTDELWQVVKDFMLATTEAEYEAKEYGEYTSVEHKVPKMTPIASP